MNIGITSTCLILCIQISLSLSLDIGIVKKLDLGNILPGVTMKRKGTIGDTLSKVGDLRACRRVLAFIAPLLSQSQSGDRRRNRTRRVDIRKAGKQARDNRVRPFIRFQEIFKAKQEAADIDDVSQGMLETSSDILKRYNLSSFEIRECLPLLGILIPDETLRKCQVKLCLNITCQPQNKYRTMDGSCNNVLHPNWGKSLSCFERLVPAAYDDGLESPRRFVNGKELPNPRLVSSVVHHDKESTNTNISIIFVPFGQFIDHDLTLTPSNTGPGKTKIECCGNMTVKHPECCHISVYNDDYFFGQFKYSCINLVRSATCPNECKLGPREHINELTFFIDGSMIYGSTNSEANYLRTMKEGKLKSNLTRNGEECLPPSQNVNEDQCSRPHEDKYCYSAGDKRANEQPGLTALHTIFLRHHNRIATQLAEMWGSTVTDEILFQETRRIVVAQIQSIVYKEFLPILLGPKLWKFFQLDPLLTGYTAYNREMNPTTSQEFSSSAYRFGHSMISNDMHMTKSDGQLETLVFRNYYFQPFLIQYGQLNNLIEGFCKGHPQGVDSNMAEAVTNYLFQVPGSPHGMDLASINIQRGRERGIAAYIVYVEYCLDIKITCWTHLNRLMKKENILKLKKAYRTVHEIDLFTGGMCETAVPEGIIGPTFACIIGIAFHKLKFGDQYYFEHGELPGSFNKEQLNELRKTTFSAVIAKNTKIKEIQQNVFNRIGQGNQLQEAIDYDDLNLKLWENELVV